jgi:hypothetical protein
MLMSQMIWCQDVAADGRTPRGEFKILNSQFPLDGTRYGLDTRRDDSQNIGPEHFVRNF